MYRGGQLRDISEVSEVGVKTIQQFRHLGSFTHPPSSSPSVDHGWRETILHKRLTTSDHTNLNDKSLLKTLKHTYVYTYI